MVMRTAALCGALFVASAQGFQPTVSFHGRSFAAKAMSSRLRQLILHDVVLRVVQSCRAGQRGQISGIDH